MAEVLRVTGARVLEFFPAGGPRGSWPAEESAARRRACGEAVRVVMDLDQDAFLVVAQDYDAGALTG